MKTKFNSLKELVGRRDALLTKGHDVYAQAGEDMDFSKVTCLVATDTAGKVAELDIINKELNDVCADLKEMEALVKSRAEADKAADFKGLPPKETPGETKDTKLVTLGKQFMEKMVATKAYKQQGAVAELDIDLKSIVQTGAGWAPESIRLPRVELYPLRPLRVADIFPAFTTDMSDIKYMEETTHTNNAAEIAEETSASSPTAYGEAALAMTERSVPVEKIAVWIPVTEEQIEDVAGAEEFINSRLIYMVRNRLDGQLVAGNGSTPNIRGVLNASSIQTQAKGADPTPDAFFKAMTLVRGVTAGTGFGEPSACLVHPSDWQDIRLLRTADGIYIFGNPSDPGPDRLWGVPVVVTSAETEGTGCVGDFANYAALFTKRGVRVEMTNSHGELFASGVLAIKATIRCAAVYFRGSSFCKVTDI